MSQSSAQDLCATSQKPCPCSIGGVTSPISKLARFILVGIFIFTSVYPCYSLVMQRQAEETGRKGQTREAGPRHNDELYR
jgi:hypothetical protein